MIAPIPGPTITLRPVTIADAAEIIRLRTDPKCDGFLMPTSPDIARQEQWIENYLTRAAAGTELYFVACLNSDGHVCGALRIDSITPTDFHFGSWVTERGAPVTVGLESYLLIMDHLFLDRNAERCTFEVRRGNEGSLRFHPRLGAEVVGENEEEFHFLNTRENYTRARKRYAKAVPRAEFVD